MDTLTHVAVGACMGQAMAGKQLGKKAMWWGAVAHSLPDIDFLMAGFLDTSQNLLAHRGITHSILIGTCMSLLLVPLAIKWHGTSSYSLKQWLLFLPACVWMHEFMDGFNNYGIGWLEPFDHHRFSLNAIYIVDPIFSLIPGLALLGLIFYSSGAARQKIARWGLIWVFAYLGFSACMKLTIESQVKRIIQAEGLPSQKLLTTPAPFQNLFWFVISGNDSGFYTGYRSVFDEDSMQWKFSPRNEHLLAAYANRPDIRRLKRFSNGFYTVNYRKDSLQFNDLRFGQIIGWQDSREEFAFHYYVQYPEENHLVVQRGRFDKLGQIKLTEYLSRIFGN